MYQYQHDRGWADSLETQVIAILTTLLPDLVILSVTSQDIDNNCGVDMEVRMRGGAIAVRLRRFPCTWRDWTVRAHRDSGAKTERAKLKEGYAHRYFYGWVDKAGTIAEWMLINLVKVREVGLLDWNWPLIPNKDPITKKPDGTYFIAISRDVLHEHGCILQSCIAEKKQRQVNTQVSTQEGLRRAEQTKCYLPKVKRPSMPENQPSLWEQEGNT